MGNGHRIQPAETPANEGHFTAAGQVLLLDKTADDLFGLGPMIEEIVNIL
jgi:hypothetical protein